MREFSSLGLTVDLFEPIPAPGINASIYPVKFFKLVKTFRSE